MAGSIKWFEYTTDAGDTFALKMDESNGEAVGNVDYSATSTATFALPRNIQPRVARYTSADGLYARSICVGSNTATPATLPQTIEGNISGSAGTITLSLASYTGEKFTAIPRAGDTGLDDGDDT